MDDTGVSDAFDDPAHEYIAIHAKALFAPQVSRQAIGSIKARKRAVEAAMAGCPRSRQ